MRMLSSLIRASAWRYCLLVGVVAAVSVSATPLLTVRAEQVVVSSTDTTGVLGIYMRNTVDTVVGYQFWLQLDRPDIALFDEAFDTGGTLSSGWDLVHVRSLSGIGADAMVVGLANDITVEGAGVPIAPSETERLLVRIPFRVLAIPDTMTERTATVSFDPFPSHLSFSRPDGTTIGLVPAIAADTLCFRCIQWFQDICLQWQVAAEPPCDSTDVLLDTVPVLDTLKLVTIPGSITLCNRTVQDIDINRDGTPFAVSDLVALMRFVMGDTNEIGDPRAADVNGDCIINWADAIMLDSLMFKIPWNPPPEFPLLLPCTCDEPVFVCCWQIRGNLSGDIQHVVDLSDLSYLVGYLVGDAPHGLKCFDEANIDGVGIVDLTDLSYLVAYLVGSGAPPVACP